MTKVSAVALALLGTASSAGSTSIETLVDRADLILRGTTSAGVVDMQVKTASFDRSYRIVMWDDNRGDGRTLVKILGPALWRGFGTLKVGSQLKLYNPRTNHVTVVSQSMLGDDWMGSHFTNDDLVKETRLARDYDAHPVRTWQATGPDGQACTFHRIELTPRSTAPVAWGKILFELWERGDLVLPVRTEYFRKVDNKTPERTLVFSEVKEMGGRLVPARMEMTVTSKPGEFTAISYRTLRFDVAIPAGKFTEQALRE